MPIFDDNDFNSVQKALTEMPDGMIDGSHYYELFCDFLEHLERLDILDSESKVKFMMGVINHVYTFDENDEKVFNGQYITDLVSCLCFHLMTLIQIGYTFNYDFKNQYVMYLQEEVMPVVKEETKSMPYWMSNE